MSFAKKWLTSLQSGGNQAKLALAVALALGARQVHLGPPIVVGSVRQPVTLPGRRISRRIAPTQLEVRPARYAEGTIGPDDSGQMQDHSKHDIPGAQEGRGGSIFVTPITTTGVVSAAIPYPSFVWPIDSRLINQSFSSWHHGIDINATRGEPLVAADSGTVIHAGWDWTGYGNLVVIDHGNGFSTYYAHQSQILVQVGQAVHQGELIGYAGSTGWATGPHLHFEIHYRGVPVNPLSYLPAPTVGPAS